MTKKESKNKIMNKVGKESQSEKKFKTERARGRVFEGRVVRKFPKRVMIEFERMIYIRKYERYLKSRTRIHARVPENMEKEIKLGDLIRIQECRPLSKIIHFIVIKKLKDSSGDEK